MLTGQKHTMFDSMQFGSPLHAQTSKDQNINTEHSEMCGQVTMSGVVH